MREVVVNGRWTLLLPDHRADRPEWPWWEATRLAAMHHHIEPGDVVWDVGAEEGDFPGLYALWGASVVMAEPNPRVWPNIRAIWDANGFERPHFTWAGFFGNTVEGEIPPYRDGWPESAYGDLIGDHGFCQLGERPDIPTITIDRVVENGTPAPHVLTMDVEGSEFQVLEGASMVLSVARPKVFVSIHPEFMLHHYGLEDGVQLVRDFMAGFEYDEKFLCIDHEHHWMFLPR